jgi:stalled ribosome rescue protein Dom34
MGKPKRKPKRGYPLALMIGFEPMSVFFWNLYSERAELRKVHKMPRKFKNMDKTNRYQFYENLVNELRPILKQGMKSILLVTPPKKKNALGFQEHIQHHHQWMLNENHPHCASFKTLTGQVTDLEQTSVFIQSAEFQEALGQVHEREADQIVGVLEKRLNDPNEGFVLHTLKEIEDLIYAGGKRKKNFKSLPLTPEYIILTNQYLEEHPNKNRLQRLLQIAKNRNIKTKIIDSETGAGIRTAQLGGIVCFLAMNSQYEKKKGEEFFEKR